MDYQGKRIFFHSGRRRFVVPKLNFETKQYIDMIDWFKCDVTEPPITADLTVEELKWHHSVQLLTTARLLPLEINQESILVTTDALDLNSVTRFNIVWRVRTFLFLPKACRKTRYMSGIAVFDKPFYSKCPMIFRPTPHED
ncbi:hypothetical protein AVEN_214982-1 [Araneus ventricosus]|uniref:Uncharacterized protein n=1 Tax=Araneus ventricosus TaxID=182803 RepID=A0A4Y2KR14_ARAVE|nr:hypothetical protein AVEN_214982-1 [Araneus ventricosus]